MDQERSRQHADQNGYRQEGMPSTLAGGKTMSDPSVTPVDVRRAGLPPLRSSVGMPMSSMHQYLISHDSAQHPQLAPLLIPGSSSQGRAAALPVIDPRRICFKFTHNKIALRTLSGIFIQAWQRDRHQLHILL